MGQDRLTGGIFNPFSYLGKKGSNDGTFNPFSHMDKKDKRGPLAASLFVKF